MAQDEFEFLPDYSDEFEFIGPGPGRAPRPLASEAALHPALADLTRSRTIGGARFRVTSTTGDVHAPTSPHYRGGAIDIVPELPPEQWDRVIAALERQGYRVVDERQRRSPEWTGPHLHVEVGAGRSAGDIFAEAAEARRRRDRGQRPLTAAEAQRRGRAQPTPTPTPQPTPRPQPTRQPPPPPVLQPEQARPTFAQRLRETAQRFQEAGQQRQAAYEAPLMEAARAFTPQVPTGTGPGLERVMTGAELAEATAQAVTAPHPERVGQRLGLRRFEELQAWMNEQGQKFRAEVRRLLRERDFRAGAMAFARLWGVPALAFLQALGDVPELLLTAGAGYRKILTDLGVPDDGSMTSPAALISGVLNGVVDPFTIAGLAGLAGKSPQLLRAARRLEQAADPQLIRVGREVRAAVHAHPLGERFTPPPPRPPEPHIATDPRISPPGPPPVGDIRIIATTGAPLPERPPEAVPRPQDLRQLEVVPERPPRPEEIGRLREARRVYELRRDVQVAYEAEVARLRQMPPETLAPLKRTPFDTPEVLAARAVAERYPHSFLVLRDPVERPRRLQLWRRWVDELMTAPEANPAGRPAQERVAVIVLGPPAAGKSSTLVEPIARQIRARIIDSDMVKVRIPEFQGGRGPGGQPGLLAGRVHIESAVVTKQLFARTVRNGDNLVYALVGHEPQRVTRLIDALERAGYTVHLRLVDLPGEEVARRLSDRFLATGRFVDPEYAFTRVGDRPRATYDTLKVEGRVASHGRYANDVPLGEPPRYLEGSFPPGADPLLARGRDLGGPGPRRGDRDLRPRRGVDAGGGGRAPPGGGEPEPRAVTRPTEEVQAAPAQAPGPLPEPAGPPAIEAAAAGPSVRRGWDIADRLRRARARARKEGWKAEVVRKGDRPLWRVAVPGERFRNFHHIALARAYAQEAANDTGQIVVLEQRILSSATRPYRLEFRPESLRAPEAAPRAPELTPPEPRAEAQVAPRAELPERQADVEEVARQVAESWGGVDEALRALDDDQTFFTARGYEVRGAEVREVLERLREQIEPRPPATTPSEARPVQPAEEARRPEGRPAEPESVEARYEQGKREYAQQDDRPRELVGGFYTLAGIARVTGDDFTTVRNLWEVVGIGDTDLPLPELRQRMASFLTHGAEKVRQEAKARAWGYYQNYPLARDKWRQAPDYHVDASRNPDLKIDLTDTAQLRQLADPQAAQFARRGTKDYESRVDALIPFVRREAAQKVRDGWERVLEKARRLAPPKPEPDNPWALRARQAAVILGEDHEAVKAARQLAEEIYRDELRNYDAWQNVIKTAEERIKQADAILAEPPPQLPLRRPEESALFVTQQPISRVFPDKLRNYRVGDYYGDSALVIEGTPPKGFQAGIPGPKENTIRQVIADAARDARPLRLVAVEDRLRHPMAIFVYEDGTLPRMQEHVLVADARRAAWLQRTFGEEVTLAARPGSSAAVVLRDGKPVGAFAFMRLDDDTGRAIEAAVAAFLKEAPRAPVPPKPKRGPRRRTLEQANEENREQAMAALAAAGQRGALRLPGLQPAGEIPAEVRVVLDAGRPSMRVRLQQAWRKRWEGFQDFFTFEGPILRAQTAPGHTPQALREEFRYLRDLPQRLQARVVDELANIFAVLEDDRAVWRVGDYLVLRDLAEEFAVAAREGRAPSIPGGLSEDLVQRALAAAAERLTDTDRQAVTAWDRLKAALRDEYVRRGLGNDDDFRQFHFRHYVLDYIKDFGPEFGLPRRLKQPTRRELRGRRGSQRLINTDPIDVLHRELLAFHRANATEDFFRRIRPMVDWTRHVGFDPQTGRWVRRAGRQDLEMRPLRPGERITLDDGTELVAWQFDPGNAVYPGHVLDARLTREVTERTLDVDELAELLEETKGVAARRGLVIGRKRPVVLIDPRLARRLDNLQYGREVADLFRRVTGLTGIWKRALVDTLGVPFQLRNWLGDLDNLFTVGRGAPAIGRVDDAARILIKDARGQKLTDAEREILRLAREHSVLRSGMVAREVGRAPRLDPRLRHLLPPGERLGRMPASLVTAYETAASIREDVTRLAYFMEQLDRIRRGEVVQASRAVDLTGLDLRSVKAAAKAAREVFVDYGARSPFEESAAIFAPFVTWYYQNTRTWLRLARREPVRLAVRVVPIYAATAVWNNSGERREIERQLPPWQRVAPHLITGWRLPDGRPLIVRLSGAFESAAQVVGLNRLYDLAQQVARGDLTLDEATARAQNIPQLRLRDVGAAILGEAAGALAYQTGPFLQVPAENLLYWRGGPAMDIRRGVPRLPERLEHTRRGDIEFLRQQVEQLVPPAAILRRNLSPERRPPPGTSLAARAALATGLVQAPNLEAEARRRREEAERRAERWREEKLAAVEEVYVQGGDWQAELRRQNQAPGPRISRDWVLRRLSPRVQIRRLEYRLAREGDPAVRAQLQRRLQALRRRQARESERAVPRSARPYVQPRP